MKWCVGGSISSCVSILALTAAISSGASEPYAEQHVKNSAAASERAFLDVEGDDGPVESTRPSVSLAEDNFFMPDSCPFVVSGHEEARAIEMNTPVEENVINLRYYDKGRAGNRFMTLSSYLAMGFCCKSRLLTLPESNEALPSVENGLPFAAAHRWFDFRSATTPFEEYQGLSEDPRMCPQNRTNGGVAAFRHLGIHDEMLGCMRRVKLRGCEAAYLGSLVDKDRACPKQDPKERTGAGSLVIHIRSGDIFDTTARFQMPRFGQPPLLFYLLAIESQPWDDVTILTSAETWGVLKGINPTFIVLETMAKSGALGPNVRTFQNRTLLEDLDSMLCADGLVAARSSMSFLTFAHTRATRFFVPSECGNGQWRMGDFSTVATYDNTTFLALERPDAQVYGIKWQQGSQTNYSVYQKWEKTEQQLMEMVTYDGIVGLQKCSVNPN